MSDAEQAFLRAILADPSDDLPRLIFADYLRERGWQWADVLAPVVAHPDCDQFRLLASQWLDEHGDPDRAEFIRVQCRLDSTYDDALRDGKGKWDLAGGASLDEYRALRRREQKLLAVRWPYWWDGLPGIFGEVGGRRTPTGPDFDKHVGGPGLGDDRLIRYHLSRGDVAEVTLSWPDWLAHHAALLDACPLRRVNRGTADAPDWRGDGLVRLTDTPEIEMSPRNTRTSRLQFRLRGCARWHNVNYLRWDSDAANRGGALNTHAVLAAEFPGVVFEMPAADARGNVLRDVQFATR